MALYIFISSIRSFGTFRSTYLHAVSSCRSLISPTQPNPTQLTSLINPSNSSFILRTQSPLLILNAHRNQPIFKATQSRLRVSPNCAIQPRRLTPRYNPGQRTASRTARRKNGQAGNTEHIYSKPFSFPFQPTPFVRIYKNLQFNHLPFNTFRTSSLAILSKTSVMHVVMKNKTLFATFPRRVDPSHLRRSFSPLIIIRNTRNMRGRWCY